ncbi:hypothetical protein [Candidatus Parabeggiatoa sp. HSG14]|uniref:hypothetical protein n=1 Tax=Candidatus Parabeggiatoa sp. HSG14 TaxID=3055593 RepID=UPI0025A85C8A|nr:hypothetical protein [Thiotrichales bacterium HSG14]
MNETNALKLLEISAKLMTDVVQAKATTEGHLTDAEINKIFSTCVDMVHEKFIAFSTVEQDVNEKFATIGEMHKVFAEKFVELEKKEERFATIGEMHRIFAEKFTEIDRRLATLPPLRPSRRPV